MTNNKSLLTSSFPKEFWWGVATSSYQVEGHVDGCGKPWKSDWDVFTENNIIKTRVATMSAIGINTSLGNPEEAVHHSCIDVFKDDVMLAKSIGMNTYRLSIEWSRIQPVPPKNNDPTYWIDGEDFDQESLSMYSSMIDFLIQNQIRPIVTLNHLTLPTWIMTPPTILFPDPSISDLEFMRSLQGWENTKTLDAYVKFVEFIVTKFKDDVNCWLTLNEPVASMIGLGYLAGIWSPGFIMDSIRARKAYFNLIRAHVNAYDVIKRVTNSSMVGIAHAVAYPKIGVPIIPVYSDNAKNQFEYFYTYHFLNSVVSGTVDTSLNFDPLKQTNQDCKQFFGIELKNWSPKLDFIGVNYYRSVYVHHIPGLECGSFYFSGGVIEGDQNKNKFQPCNILNDLGWEIYPEGLYMILKSLDQKYNLSILITENGIPEKFDRINDKGIRASFIIAHLQQLLNAMRDGVNVIGYIHWSLVDNFEWQESYNNQSRFGLYSIDRTEDYKVKGLRSYTRTVTKGAIALQDIIKHGDIIASLEKYGTISPDGKMLVHPESG